MRIHDREPLGAALRRFKRLLERSGITKELRKHKNYEKACEARRAPNCASKTTSVRARCLFGISRIREPLRHCLCCWLPLERWLENMLDQGTVQKHIKELEKGGEASRRQALQFLKHIERSEWDTAPPSVLQSLVASLQQQLLGETTHPWIQREVATILGNLGRHSKTAVEQLIRLLQDGIPDSVREPVVKALGQFGAEAKGAVDGLIVLSKGRTNLAIHAVCALSEIGCADHRVRSALVDLWLLGAQSQNGQGQLAIALCKLRIDAKGLLDFLVSNLASNQSHAIRKAAAEALAWHNKDEVDVVPALLAASLNDGTEEVRQAAQAALNQLHVTHEKAIQLCVKRLKDSSCAETALRKSGQLAVPALVKALDSEETTTRVKAIQILAYLGELAAMAVPALRKALHDKNSDIRLAAAKGLWKITNKADLAVPVLVQLLEEKRPADGNGSESRRQYLQTVIEALWRIGPPAAAAVPALRSKTRDANRLIGESAANAIGRIAPSSAS